MDATAIGRFRSLDGFVEVTQGLLVDSSLSRLGRAWHTCAGNILFGLGYTMIAAVSIVTCLWMKSDTRRCRPSSGGCLRLNIYSLCSTICLASKCGSTDVFCF